jgi:hypothetical protein
MDLDSWWSGISWGKYGHFHLARTLGADPPKRGRALVTQDCLVSAAKDGRHPVPEPGELRTTDGVNATPDRVKTAPRDPVPDRFGAHPKSKQLRPSHNPMLSSRKPPDRSM